QRTGRYRVQLGGVGAVVPDPVQFVRTGLEVAAVGRAVRDVVDAHGVEGQGARGGQRDPLVALAALLEVVGDRARSGDGIAVVAGRIPLAPGNPGIAGGGQVPRALAVGGAQRRRAG